MIVLAVVFYEGKYKYAYTNAHLSLDWSRSYTIELYNFWLLIYSWTIPCRFTPNFRRRFTWRRTKCMHGALVDTAGIRHVYTVLYIHSRSSKQYKKTLIMNEFLLLDKSDRCKIPNIYGDMTFLQLLSSFQHCFCSRSVMGHTTPWESPISSWNLSDSSPKR